jgi:methyltransferase (TIGR00027 family)
VPGLPDVSLTAFGVAAARAAETDRGDRLFADPFAAAFVRAAGSSGWAQGSERRRPGALVDWINVRTRFLDDLLLETCASGARQIVILGAGLDARAFRLPWPDKVRLFELDLPGVLQFKQSVIESEGWQPSCERIAVPVDLTEDWSRHLLGAGFEAGSPVAWIAEGLLAYLSQQTSDSLVAHTAELSASGSGPADYVGLWRSANAEQAVEWLGSYGWRAKVFDVLERSAAYGRPLSQQARGENNARLVDAEWR